LRAHLLGQLGRLGHDPQGLLQSHGIALGGEILATAEPGGHEVGKPEQCGERNDDARTESVYSHAPKVRGARLESLAPRGCVREQALPNEGIWRSCTSSVPLLRRQYPAMPSFGT